MPNGIKTRIINKGEKNIIIFEVETSEYSPHQTGNTYYMRIDGQTRPAPHHYVEALFKKIKYPNIEAHISVDNLEISHHLARMRIILTFVNWSPLQNEEDLYFRLITDVGKFNMATIPHLSHLYRMNGREFYKESAKKIMHYGPSVFESQVIDLDTSDLAQNHFRASLFLYFGGRFSPYKGSVYNLDFYSGNTPNDKNSVMTVKFENRIIKEIQDELGMNREDILSDQFHTIKKNQK
jgi:hypothetical protein